MAPIRPSQGLSGPHNHRSPAQRLERFESSLVIARILEGNDTDLGLSESVTRGMNLREALNRLPETRARQSVAPFGDQLEDLWALSGEGNADLFFEALVDIGRHLESQDRFDAAGRIYFTIVDLNPDLELSPERRNSVAHAQERLDLFSGRGTWGSSSEFWGRRLLRDSVDPTLLVGIGAASLAYRSVRLLALSRLIRPIARADVIPLALASPAVRASILFRPDWSYRLSASIMAGFVATTAETYAYCLATRLMDELRGRPQDWNISGFRNEAAAMLFVFGSMRFFGGASTLLARRAMGIRHPAVAPPRNQVEELSWIFGHEPELRATIRRLNPPRYAGRIQGEFEIIAADRRLDTPSRLQRLTHEAALQTGMVTGLVFAHRVMDERGHPLPNVPSGDILGNSLRILAQVNLMRILPVFRQRTADLERSLEGSGGLFFRPGARRLPH